MQGKIARSRKGMQVRGRGGPGAGVWWCVAGRGGGGPQALPRACQPSRSRARGLPSSLSVHSVPTLSNSAPQAATNINTPRSIRSRLSFPRHRKAPDAAAVPEAPQQQVVRSASGRMAMG